MAQDIFYPSLNDFCRRYLIAGQPLTEVDKMLFETRLNEQRDALFEQFLLFDRISFKVYGENTLIPVLIGFFGEKGFEALIDQGALGFVLWTPNIVYLEKNIPGINAIGAGTLTSPAHADPERSIELGLNFMTRKMSPRGRKRLVRKILPLYTLPAADLPQDATAVVNSAFASGRLAHFGLDPSKKALDSLEAEDKRTLARCAEDLLEYKFIMLRGMTSFSEYKFYSPFWDTAEKFRTIQQMQTGFRQIATIHGFPDLKALCGHIDAPLAKVPKLRQNRNAVKFRDWLETTVGQSVDQGFTKLYVDSIANRKGLFDSAPAKFTKAVAMTALGAVAGAALGGPAGATLGAGLGGLSAGALEAAGHLGLDLLDAFAWDAVARGWSPRLFFSDLERLRRESQRQID